MNEEQPQAMKTVSLDEWNKGTPITLEEEHENHQAMKTVSLDEWNKGTPISDPEPQIRRWNGNAAAPLSFAAPSKRIALKDETAKTEDPETERKRIALSYFFANEYQVGTDYAHKNIDTFLKKFYGQGATVDSVYQYLSGPPPRNPFLKIWDWGGAVIESCGSQIAQTANNVFSVYAEGAMREEQAKQLAAGNSSVAQKFETMATDIRSGSISRNAELNAAQEKIVANLNSRASSDIEKAVYSFTVPVVASIIHYMFIASIGGAGTVIAATGLDAAQQKELDISQANPDMPENQVEMAKVASAMITMTAQAALHLVAAMALPKTTVVNTFREISDKGMRGVAQVGSGQIMTTGSYAGFSPGVLEGLAASGETVIRIADRHFVSVQVKNAINYAMPDMLKLFGVNIAGGSTIGAARKLAENAVDIGVGLKDGDQWSEGIGQEALAGGIWGAAFAVRDHWRYYSGPTVRRALRDFSRRHWEEMTPRERYEAKQSAKIAAESTIANPEAKPFEVARAGIIRDAVNSDEAAIAAAASNMASTVRPIQATADPARTTPRNRANTAPVQEDSQLRNDVFAAEAEEIQQLNTELPFNPAETRGRLEELKTMYPGANIEIVDEWTPELQNKIRQSGKILARETPAFFDIGSNTAYFNVSKLRPSAADKKFVHEVISHNGIRSLLGDRADEFYDQVYRDFADDEIMQRIIEKYQLAEEDEYGELLLQDMTAEQKQEAADEFVSSLGEEAIKPEGDRAPWYSRAISKIREILRRFFPNIPWTIRDIENMIRASARNLRQKRYNARTANADGQRFSIEKSSGKFELLKDSVKQKFGSGKTSLRQVAAGFKKIDFQPGTVNLDLGGGRFDEGTMYLAEQGVTNLVFDPVNRSSEHNRAIFEAVKSGGVDTVTCNNVLNVIQEPEARDNVILQAAKALKPGGTAYFTVYEGDGSGNGRQSQADAWQENRKTADYLGEVKKHFAEVTIKNKVIIARDPQTEGKLSAWALDATFENPLRFSLPGEDEPDIEDADSRAIEIIKSKIGTKDKYSIDEVTQILRDSGFDIAEEEAGYVLQEAQLAARKDRRKQNQRRNVERRHEWLYDNVPMYRYAVDFGDIGFKIKLDRRVATKEDTGAFIAKDGESGIDSVELARYIARMEGREGKELEIEEDIAAFFRYLKKSELYQMYYDAIREEKDLDKRAKEEYAKYIEDEVKRIIEAEQSVTREMLEENPGVAKILFDHVLGKTIRGEIADTDIEDLNIAMTAKDPQIIAHITRSIRERMREEYAEKMNEYRAALRQNFRDAEKMQAEALKIIREFIPFQYQGKYLDRVTEISTFRSAAKRKTALDKLCKKIIEDDSPAITAAAYSAGRAKNAVYSELNREHRDKYLSRIISILKIASPQKRIEKFNDLISDVMQEADDIRKVTYLEKIKARLVQLSPKVSGARRIVGTRSIDAQNVIAEIRRYFEMSPADAEEERSALYEIAENAYDSGDEEGAADADAHLALLGDFSRLAERSGEEAVYAFETLQMIAQNGRNELLEQIARIRRENKAISDMIVRRVTSGRGVAIEQEAEHIKNQQRESLIAKLKNYAYDTLKLEDRLYLLATNGEQGDWLENPVGRLFQAVHIAAVQEFTARRNFTHQLDSMLDNSLGTSNSITRAAELQKLRTRAEHTGVFRHMPSQREITYTYVTEETAKEMLAAFDEETGTLLPYQAEILRDRLRDRERKVAKTYKKEEVGDKMTNEVYAAMDKEKGKEGKADLIGIPYVKFSGAPVEWVERTQLEALTMKMGWAQRDVRYKMIFNGWTEEAIKQLDDFLLPETKTLGEHLARYYAEQYARLNEIYKQVYYAELPHIENYSPILYPSRNVASEKTAPALDAPEAPFAAPRRLAPGSIKARAAHLMEPKAADALTVFVEHTRRTDHFIAWAIPARSLRGALFTPEVRDACDQVFGSGFFEGLKNDVTDTINGGSTAAVNVFAQKMFNSAVGLRMAFGYVSAAKQVMSGFAYANDLTTGDFVMGLMYSWTHPIEAMRPMLTSDYLKNRITSGANLFEAMALGSRNRYVATERMAGKIGRVLHLSGAAAGTSQFIEAAKYWGGLAQRLGDAFPVVIFGSAVYHAHYKRLINEGFTQKEAEQKALLRWEMSTESLQQSAAVHNQNMWQRSQLGKFFTTFKSANILGGQRALREIIAGSVFGKKDGSYTDTTDWTDGEKTYSGSRSAQRGHLFALGVSLGALYITGVLIRLVEAADREGRKAPSDRRNIGEILTDAALSAPLDALSMYPYADYVAEIITKAILAKSMGKSVTTALFQSISAPLAGLGVDDLMAAATRLFNYDIENSKSKKDPAEKIFEGMAYTLRSLGGINSGAGTIGAAMLRGKQLTDYFTASSRESRVAKSPSRLIRRVPRRKRR